MTDTNPKEQPEADRNCAKCQSLLATGAIGEICEACMLQVGFESAVNAPPTHEAAEGASEAGNAPTSAQAGELPPELSIEEVQTLFPDLDILEVIGQGGMGVVYKAKQKHLARMVALKLLRSKCSQDPSLAERFTREARALAKLAHPNIVGVHDFGQAGDRPYLLMEYIDGTNLRAMLSSHQLSPQEAMAMVSPICDALQFAHEEGVVHRDIKPENILVDRRGRVRIADFGLARLMSRSKDEWTLTGTRQVMGTPHYMAPEQMDRPQEVDHRADIFSLGVVIYEMLTGELPIGRFDLPSQKLGIDVRLDSVVLRTLEKEPSRRYQHASEVQTDVQHIFSKIPESKPKATLDFSQPAVYLPAVGLLIAGAINALVGIGILIRFDDDYVAVGGLHVLAAIPLGIGGWKMLSGGSREWTIIAIVFGLLPFHFGAFLSFPCALWLLFSQMTRQLIGSAGTSHSDFRMNASRDSAASQVGGSAQRVAQKFAPAAQYTRSLGARSLAGVMSLVRRCCQLIVAFPWRKVLRAVVACFLWLLLCTMLASLVAYWGYERVPSKLQVIDQSASNVAIVGEKDLYLQLTASGRVEAVGFSKLPDVPSRTSVYLALSRMVPTQVQERRAVSRGEFQTASVVVPRQFFSSEQFRCELTEAGTWEYAIEPKYGNYMVQPNRLFDDNIGNMDIDRESPRIIYSSSYDTSFEYLPPLENADDLTQWLRRTELETAKCEAIAAGIFATLTELASSGGMAQSREGERRLKPIAAMLDPAIFQPQNIAPLSVRFEPEMTVLWGLGLLAGLLALTGCYFIVLRFTAHDSMQLATSQDVGVGDSLSSHESAVVEQEQPQRQGGSGTPENPTDPTA